MAGAIEASIRIGPNQMPPTSKQKIENWVLIKSALTPIYCPSTTNHTKTQEDNDMARYIAEVNFPQSNPNYEFIGWDEIDGKSTEATRADRLDMKMGKAMKAAFEDLAPGQSFVTAGGGRILRIF